MGAAFLMEYERLRSKIERRLGEYFAQSDAPQLTEAMRYSLLAGGKRIRPVITLAFCNTCGGNEELALDAACAVELLHTYSLIHDDLPAMDDDDMRRGRPSNHKMFGEWRAILAGDALQAAAFEKLARCGLPPERIVKMMSALAVAAGERGMCAGQALDMEAEKSVVSADIGAVRKIHGLKTAAVIEAAALIGVYAAGGSESELTAASKYARAVGLAFQVRDDVLDAESTVEALGKPVGSDVKSGKATFYVLLGAQACEELVADETDRAKLAVRDTFADCGFLCGLADMLAGRNS